MANCRKTPSSIQQCLAMLRLFFIASMLLPIYLTITREILQCEILYFLITTNKIIKLTCVKIKIVETYFYV